jgi:hypothetical protein
MSLAVAAPALAGVRFGPPRPVCDQEIQLEGLLYVEVFDPETHEPPRFVVIDSGKTDPIVLEPRRTYQLSLRAGPATTAPIVPAFFRLETRSVLTLTAWGVGEAALPLSREYSINTITDLRVRTGEPGRRKMYLRVSECYKGGSRFLHHPNETLVPLVVSSLRGGGTGGEP